MTRPTDSMREAMRCAEVGDDVCHEDPTVNRLLEMSAEKTGKEAALFVPSGTFGNQCSIGVHTSPGDEIIVGEQSHVIEHECGAIGALWGAVTRTVAPAKTSYLTAADVEKRLRLSSDIHEPRTGLIVLENALSDGTVMPLDAMAEIAKLARKHGIPVHLDGARLFNAALALGVDAAQICRHVDTVTFCLSKGLGAPVGSVLCGTGDFINKALKQRKMMGGGMRQVGVLAAPGIIALTRGVERLAEDHANARLLASLLLEIPGIQVDMAAVQTNMVFCRVNKDGKSETGLVDYLAERGFNNYPPSWWGLRFVLSYEVDEDDVRAFAEATRAYMQ